MENYNNFNYYIHSQAIAYKDLGQSDPEGKSIKELVESLNKQLQRANPDLGVKLLDLRDFISGPGEPSYPQYFTAISIKGNTQEDFFEKEEIFYYLNSPEYKQAVGILEGIVAKYNIEHTEEGLV